MFTNKIEVRLTNNQHIVKESYQAFCQVSMPLIAICKNEFKKVCTTWPSWYHVLRGVAMSTDFFADHRLNWICKSLVAVINSSKWKEDHHKRDGTVWVVSSLHLFLYSGV